MINEFVRGRAHMQNVDYEIVNQKMFVNMK